MCEPPSRPEIAMVLSDSEYEVPWPNWQTLRTGGQCTVCYGSLIVAAFLASLSSSSSLRRTLMIHGCLPVSQWP